MKRLLFTYDVYRSSAFRLPSVIQNKWWLKGLFFDLFKSAGFSVGEFAPASEGGTFDVDRYRRILDLPKSADGWAAAIAMRVPDDAKTLFKDLNDSDAAIGWGLTPSLMDFLDQSGVSFIDIEIDPIRFANDLFFRMRTNNKRVARLLKQLHVDSEELRSSVANIRGYVSRRNPSALNPGRSLGLFAAQTTVDLSIVSSGRIATPENYLSEIRQIADEVDVFLVKPHPCQNDNSHISQVLTGIPNAHLCRSNIYRILTDINLRHVVGLSSSVLHEASLFGVPATHLISPDREENFLVPAIAKHCYRIRTNIVVDRRLPIALTRNISMARIFLQKQSKDHQPINLRRSLGGGWSLDDFYRDALLSLDLPRPPPIAHCRQHISPDKLVLYLSVGWSVTEEWGCWSEGQRHVIRVQLSDFDHETGAVATLHMVGFVHPKHPQQRVKIYVNGEMAANRIIHQGNATSAQISVAITSPSAEIIIETPDAKSPADLGLSSDKRELGVGLTSITFAPAAISPDFSQGTEATGIVDSSSAKSLIALRAPNRTIGGQNSSR